RRSVRRDNGVLEFNTAHEVEDPTAVFREAARNNVGSNGTMRRYHCAEVVVDTPATGRGEAGRAGAAARDVAAHGAVEEINSTIALGNTATLTGTATAAVAAHGGIAADG